MRTLTRSRSSGEGGDESRGDLAALAFPSHELFSVSGRGLPANGALGW
jgi:hypothetical protein